MRNTSLTSAYVYYKRYSLTEHLISKIATKSVVWMLVNNCKGLNLIQNLMRNLNT